MFVYEHLECVIKSKRNIPMHAGEKKNIGENMIELEINLSTNSFCLAVYVSICLPIISLGGNWV